MKPCIPLIVAAVALLVAAPVQSAPALADSLSWQQLGAIPAPEGFAAPFAGVSGGALIVAGGANIPGDKWADSYIKTWHDSVFVLERPDGAWKNAGKLPRPLGYGGSISVDDSLIGIGGSDATQHYSAVFRLTWRDGAFKINELASLPKRCANACCALLGRTIYVAGGIEAPAAKTALKTFWALNLDDADPRWRELEPWPGVERMLAVAGVQDGSFFLMSGVKLSPGADSKPVREFLRDAYRFTPGYGWKRIADLPRAAAAAPSPAVPRGSSQLLVLTGDDGASVNFQPVKEHPGFPRDALSYDTVSDTWRVAGAVPFSRATVPAVEWNGRFVIPNGESRPRVRTTEVWTLQLP